MGPVSTPRQPSIDQHRKAAEEAHRSGDFAAAVREQQRAVALEMEDGGRAVRARKLLSLYHFSAGQHRESLDVLIQLRELAPDDIELMENTGVILRLLGRQPEAVELLEAVQKREPKRGNVCDALAHCYANLRDDEKSRHYGALSLEQKDSEAAGREPICKVPDEAPPALACGGKKKHVISFSLWGDGHRYLKGALRNAQVASDIYPGWVVRFYCDDSVPRIVRRKLMDYGCEVAMRPRPESFFDGLLWRFEVVNDPGVDRFLIRDCDSVLNVKERVAVDEWLQSDKWFHVMRDFASHTEVILAGMWGGVSGVLPTVPEIRKQFKPSLAPTRTFDQILLRECAWPVVRQSVMIHDSVYTGTLESLPFPPVGQLPPGFHVGQNEAAVRPDYYVEMPELTGKPEALIVFVAGLESSSVDYAGSQLATSESAAVCDGGLEGLEEGAKILAVRQGVSKNNARLVRDATLASLRALAADSGETGVRGLLVPVKEIGLAEVVGLARKLAGKILYVIRHPDDEAIERKAESLEDARQAAEAWVEEIQLVSKISRELPGLIEIVRSEDLSVERRGKTLKRLATFVEVSEPPIEVDDIEELATEGELSDEMRGAIRAVAGDFMARLRYE